MTPRRSCHPAIKYTDELERQPERMIRGSTLYRIYRRTSVKPLYFAHHFVALHLSKGNLTTVFDSMAAYATHERDEALAKLGVTWYDVVYTGPQIKNECGFHVLAVIGKVTGCKTLELPEGARMRDFYMNLLPTPAPATPPANVPTTGKALSALATPSIASSCSSFWHCNCSRCRRDRACR